jgi:hypothetical protein
MNLSRRAFASGLAIAPLVGGQSLGALNAAGTSEWHAAVFDDHQLETVATLAELIIPKTDTPGAREALVHQHLDHILAASPEAARIHFEEGLWWLDGYCLRTSAKPFKDLPADEQMELLMRLHDSSEPDLRPGTEFIHLAKTWTAKIYYSTQAGEEELNKGGRVPLHYTSECSA